MKKLISIPYKIWIYVSTLFVLCIVALVLIFNFKVESTLKAKLKVEGWSEQTIEINSDDAYLLKSGDDITIKINGKEYHAQIEKVYLDERDNKFKLKLDRVIRDMISNTTLEATVIYDEHKVIEAIMSV